MNNLKKVKGSIVKESFYSDYKTWIKSLDIQIDNQEEYNHRLDAPIKGTEDTFRKQIDKGQGSELKEYTYKGKKYPPKFWNGKSSSRMCFELYSWIVDEEQCRDFSFEKKLPAINSSGSIINSKMDVYIKTSNNIWFIESKFTESPEKISDLAEAYYQTRDVKENIINEPDYKKDTYYYKVDKYAKERLVKYSLFKRYFEKEKVIQPFIEFINYFMNLEESGYKSDWFDTKQETCHLLGIIMYLIDNQEEIKNSNTKNINFRNIVFNKGGCEEYITEDDLANEFMGMGQEMVNKIIDEYKIINKNNIKENFTYSALSIQEVLKNNCDETVRESIEKNFEGINKFLDYQ